MNMHISMELLSLKLYVLADLLGIIGLAGLAVFLLAMIWMVIRAANFDSLIPPLIGVLLSLALVAGGLACSPVSSESAGLTVVAWLSDALGLDLEEVRKFADEGMDFFQDFAGQGLLDLFANEGGEPAAFKDKAKSKGDPEPAQTENRDRPESGTAQSLSAPAAVQGGAPYEAVLNGWRVRMTLPEEWVDRCVMESSGSELTFWHKASQDSGGDGYGELVTLSIVEGALDPNWAEENFRDLWEPVEADGATLFAAGPTDIPSTEEAMDDYVRLYGAIPDILDSIQMERV